MNIIDIITKKRNGGELDRSMIEFFIDAYVNNNIEDYQASALLMAICINGMNERETSALTQAMTDSGSKAELSAINGTIVDKHSTGGVGDTTTLVLAPLVAACGGKVAKMSGRGLGHTGGTIDKLESIPGFKTELKMPEFIDIVNKTGAAIIGQSGDFAPADKKLYALRDVTGTIDCIPLIASSIMSKKLASGADAIVLDVKCGNGAFMKNVDSALELADTMVAIGKHAKKEMMAVVTNMEKPLGMAIGNSIEVAEAIMLLRGEVEGALKDVSLMLGANMLMLCGICIDYQQAWERIYGALKDGSGIAKMKQMISAQGGDERVCDDLSLLPQSHSVIEITSDIDGFVSSLDALAVGKASGLLGAGRMTKNDIIDPAVGIWLKKNVGDKVSVGECIAEVYSNGKNEDEAVRQTKQAYNIGNICPEKDPIVYASVNKDGIKRYI